MALRYRHLLNSRRFNISHSPKLFQTLTVQSINPQPFRNLSTSSKRYTMSPAGHYTELPTPPQCYVDFCLIPVGTGSTSVAREVAEVQKLLKASGLTYTMHSAGTTVEGSWDDVMKVIGQAHSVVHQAGAVRVQTSMRAGTRTDKPQTAAQKVKRVEDILAKEES